MRDDVAAASQTVTAAAIAPAPRAASAADADIAIGRLRLAETAEARASRSATPRALRWPAPGALTGWFGERRRSGSHPGIDIDGSTGDPVAAAAGGLVRLAGAAPAGYGGYGLLVIVEHDGGVETLYAHLSRVAVRAGDVVAPGQTIGAIGTTGSVTGSHLHFEVRVAGRQVNPRDWLAPKAP